MRRSLYDLLGVRPDDDAENLRKAFLKAAKESHPDHHGDDPEAARRFRQIAEAYDILRDAEQRAGYDRLLEVERRPLRSKLKSTLSDVKSHIVTDAIVGVILTIVLVGGYELYARVSETRVDEVAGTTAHDSAEVAAVHSGAAERDRPAGKSAPEMPTALPIEDPAAPGDTASAGQATEVARADDGSDVPVDQAGAKAAPQDSAKTPGDEPQDRHDAKSVDVHAPAAEALNGAPRPSSSGVAALAIKLDSKTPEAVGAGAGIAKQPAEPAETRDGTPGPSSPAVAAAANKPDSKTPEAVDAGTGIAEQPAEPAETHDGAPRPPSSAVAALTNKPDSKTPEAVGAATGITKQPAEPAETHDGAARPSSSGVAVLTNKPDSKTPESVGASTGTAKQPPAETRESARLHAAMKRPLASRVPLRNSSPVHRHSLARMDHCEPGAPHVVGSGY